jgi:hypothetical protein
MRWIGHRLHADAELDIDPDLTLAQAHLPTTPNTTWSTPCRNWPPR